MSVGLLKGSPCCHAAALPLVPRRYCSVAFRSALVYELPFVVGEKEVVVAIDVDGVWSVELAFAPKIR